MMRSTGTQIRWACALVVGVVLVLSGCAPQGVASRAVTQTPTPVANLLAQRKALGIPACPESDFSVDARADGLPDVTLACIGGDSMVRLAGLRGRPMVINIWAQWCGPCRAEAPFLAEFAAAAPDDLLILGVDYNDPQPEAALTFASDSKWTWAHVVDPEKKLAGPLQLSGIPTTLFVTSDGVIAYRHVGDFTSTKEIAEFSQQYLGIA